MIRDHTVRCTKDAFRTTLLRSLPYAASFSSSSAIIHCSGSGSHSCLMRSRGRVLENQNGTISPRYRGSAIRGLSLLLPTRATRFSSQVRSYLSHMRRAFLGFALLVPFIGVAQKNKKKEPAEKDARASLIRNAEVATAAGNLDSALTWYSKALWMWPDKDTRHARANA